MQIKAIMVEDDGDLTVVRLVKHRGMLVWEWEDTLYLTHNFYIYREQIKVLPAFSRDNRKWKYNKKVEYMEFRESDLAELDSP